MFARSGLSLAITLLLFLNRPAHAIWERSESVEWWTNVSDTITVMVVAEAKGIDKVHCTTTLGENGFLGEASCLG